MTVIAQQPSASTSTDTAATIVIRPVRPADATAMNDYVMNLSAESRQLRFHARINGCTPGLLRLLTDVQPESGVAFVAVVPTADGGERIVGEARYALVAGGREAEFAISVADHCKGAGLAQRLMRTLVQAARAARVGALHGDVLANNARLDAFMQRQGFALTYDEAAEPGVLRYSRSIDGLRVPGADVLVGAARRLAGLLMLGKRPAHATAA